MTAIKIIFNGQIRRTQTERSPITFNVLESAARKLFPALRAHEKNKKHENKKNIDFQWVDEDDDKIVLSTDIELLEALRVMEGENRSTMLFEIRIRGEHEDIPVPITSITEKTVFEECSSVKPVAEECSSEALPLSSIEQLNFVIHDGVTCFECDKTEKIERIEKIEKEREIIEGIRVRGEASCIIGVRYRCPVRLIDLCGDCEKKEKQPYRMIKYYKPEQQEHSPNPIAAERSQEYSQEHSQEHSSEHFLRRWRGCRDRRRPGSSRPTLPQGPHLGPYGPHFKGHPMRVNSPHTAHSAHRRPTEPHEWLPFFKGLYGDTMSSMSSFAAAQTGYKNNNILSCNNILNNNCILNSRNNVTDNIPNNIPNNVHNVTNQIVANVQNNQSNVQINNRRSNIATDNGNVTSNFDNHNKKSENCNVIKNNNKNEIKNEDKSGNKDKHNIENKHNIIFNDSSECKSNFPMVLKEESLFTDKDVCGDICMEGIISSIINDNNIDVKKNNDSYVHNNDNNDNNHELNTDMNDMNDSDYIKYINDNITKLNDDMEKINSEASSKYPCINVALPTYLRDYIPAPSNDTPTDTTGATPLPLTAPATSTPLINTSAAVTVATTPLTPIPLTPIPLTPSAATTLQTSPAALRLGPFTSMPPTASYVPYTHSATVPSYSPTTYSAIAPSYSSIMPSYSPLLATTATTHALPHPATHTTGKTDKTPSSSPSSSLSSSLTYPATPTPLTPTPPVLSKPMVRFVRDITFPDGTSVHPSTVFLKKWCVRNDGTHRWPENVLLTNAGGYILSVETAVSVDPLSPGQEGEITLQIMAPDEVGRYVQYFRLVTPEGCAFGQRIWVDIRVMEEEQGWYMVMTGADKGEKGTDKGDKGENEVKGEEEVKVISGEGNEKEGEKEREEKNDGKE